MSKYTMKQTLCIWLALCTIFIASRGACRAEGSLYDSSDARTLTPAEAAAFGPQAANYRYDNRMIHAALIAQARAHKRSGNLCWRYVKTALLEAGAVASYPKTAFAKDAAEELPRDFGFRRIHCSNPLNAPLGSVLVYGGADAGHVEIRTPAGYASDFVSPTPYDKRPLVGVFVKPKS
ncbi:MAG TPA: hypothetical protein VEO95_04070 [Chthoniobacteraceae bacterium]|nr:hypothetical protein [Chthoniobacteraceae bacterium]